MTHFLKTSLFTAVGVALLMLTAGPAAASDTNGYVGDAVTGLESSPVFVDSDTSLTNEGAIASALNGSGVDVVVLPPVAVSTYSATDLAGLIRQETGNATVVVVVDNVGRDTIGVSSSKNATEIATVINEAMNSSNGDAGAAISSTTEEVVSLASGTGSSEPVPDAGFGFLGVILGAVVLAAAAVTIVTLRRNRKKLSGGVQLIALESKPSDEERLIENSISALKQQLQAHQGDFPDTIQRSVNGILSTLKELLPQWKKMDSYADQKFTINRIITDYLPNMLNTYMELPKSYLARTKKDTESKVLKQLDILQTAVNEIQDNVYDGVEQKIEAQGQFLETKFKSADNLKLR